MLKGGKELQSLSSMKESSNSSFTDPGKGYRLSHNRLSKSLPEHLMAGMNAEHDAIISMRLCEIRNHKYPESRGLPPPAKFTKEQSTPARFVRSCSADEILFKDNRFCHRRRVTNYEFEQVEPFFHISCNLFIYCSAFLIAATSGHPTGKHLGLAQRPLQRRKAKATPDTQPVTRGRYTCSGLG